MRNIGTDQVSTAQLAQHRPLNHTHAMIIEWDETKNEACYNQRGFDFAYATKAFFDPDRIVRADTRHSYGEARYQLMGRIEERLFIVVYTPRSHTTRIISARKANQREIKDYESRNRTENNPHDD